MGNTLAAMDRLLSRVRRTWRKPILTGPMRDCCRILDLPIRKEGPDWTFSQEGIQEGNGFGELPGFWQGFIP
jgi:hypothetical protein